MPVPSGRRRRPPSRSRDSPLCRGWRKSTQWRRRSLRSGHLGATKAGLQFDAIRLRPGSATWSTLSRDCLTLLRRARRRRRAADYSQWRGARERRPARAPIARAARRYRARSPPRRQHRPPEAKTPVLRTRAARIVLCCCSTSGEVASPQCIRRGRRDDRCRPSTPEARRSSQGPAWRKGPCGRSRPSLVQSSPSARARPQPPPARPRDGSRRDTRL